MKAEQQDFVRNLLETVSYPEPPEYVRHNDDYYTGCIAYRSALLAAVRLSESNILNLRRDEHHGVDRLRIYSSEAAFARSVYDKV